MGPLELIIFDSDDPRNRRVKLRTLTGRRADTWIDWSQYEAMVKAAGQVKLPTHTHAPFRPAGRDLFLRVPRPSTKAPTPAACPEPAMSFRAVAGAAASPPRLHDRPVHGASGSIDTMDATQ